MRHGELCSGIRHTPNGSRFYLLFPVEDMYGGNGGSGVTIFDFQSIDRWEYMERIMENVNLAEISMIRNNCMVFRFLNSYDGKFYKCLKCDQILKCCIENEALNNEPFAYFIADIYVKELSKEEAESALKYYKYGYNFDPHKANGLYFISIIGNEICIDIICESFEIKT